MGNLMQSQAASSPNSRPWYEKEDGTCTILEPTLVDIGANQPPHLMFPVHWAKSLEILPKAKQIADEHQAMLVLLLHGEASNSEIMSLVLQLAETQVLPLWIGEQNRRKVGQIISMLSNQLQGNSNRVEGNTSPS